MGQTKLTTFFAKSKQESEDVLRETREQILYRTTRLEYRELDGKCPTCAKELASLPDVNVYNFYKMDPYLRKLKLLSLCSACKKIFAVPKTGVDVLIDILDLAKLLQEKQDAERQAQPDLEDEQKYGMQCPSFRCRKLINLKKIPPKDLNVTEKVVFLQCYHCNQLIQFPREQLEEKLKN